MEKEDLRIIYEIEESLRVISIKEQDLEKEEEENQESFNSAPVKHVENLIGETWQAAEQEESR